MTDSDRIRKALREFPDVESKIVDKPKPGAIEFKKHNEKEKAQCDFNVGLASKQELESTKISKV